MGLATLIGAYNFYCSFLHWPLYKMLGRKYRWDSGAPGIGSLCLLVALAFLWQDRTAWIAAGVLAVVDTKGLPWFCGVMLVMSILKSRDSK